MYGSLGVPSRTATAHLVELRYCILGVHTWKEKGVSYPWELFCSYTDIELVIAFNLIDLI